MLANPKSGRGIAARLARDLRAAARTRGHRCKLLEVGGSERLDPEKLAHADALAVVGGDGTVNRSAAAAIEARAPIYQIPTGNENLFARALDMRRSPRAMLDAMESGQTGLADVGMAGPDPFLIMASLGPDASVVRRVALSRRRAIGHLAYVEPMVRELLRPAIPSLTVEVDGRRIVNADQGVLIIANTREYAAHLDPCPDASLFSGDLHVAFLPADGSVGVLRWGVSAWRRSVGTHPRAVVATGMRVGVDLHDPRTPIQIDGEWQNAHETQTRTEFSLQRAKLPVFTPLQRTETVFSSSKGTPTPGTPTAPGTCEVR